MRKAAYWLMWGLIVVLFAAAAGILYRDELSSIAMVLPGEHESQNYYRQAKKFLRNQDYPEALDALLKYYDLSFRKD